MLHKSFIYLKISPISCRTFSIVFVLFLLLLLTSIPHKVQTIIWLLMCLCLLVNLRWIIFLEFLWFLHFFKRLAYAPGCVEFKFSPKLGLKKTNFNESEKRKEEIVFFLLIRYEKWRNFVATFFARRINTILFAFLSYFWTFLISPSVRLKFSHTHTNVNENLQWK